MTPPSREEPIDLAHAALLIIDVQNYCTRPEACAGEYFRASLRDVILPNIQQLQLACRRTGIEIVYSVIENMTRDGRDRSLDFRKTSSQCIHLDQYRLCFAQSPGALAAYRHPRLLPPTVYQGATGRDHGID
jgi:nicotinamidase-related amidase